MKKAFIASVSAIALLLPPGAMAQEAVKFGILALTRRQPLKLVGGVTQKRLLGLQFAQPRFCGINIFFKRCQMVPA